MIRWALPGLLLVVGCATPVSYSAGPFITKDKDTAYRVVDRPGGFSVTVRYDRYQFIPESSAVATACKSALTAIAYDWAEQRGKRIESINEQRVRLSMGRNGFTGITSCEATVPADYARE